MKKIALILVLNILVINAFSQTNTFPTSGNVGIGVASPAAPLHVEGNLIVGSTAASTYHKLIINGPNTPNNIGSKRDISFEFAAAGSSLIRSYRGSSYDTYLQFLTTPNATNTPVERMHIHHDGNIGIGTITPNNKLEINGTGSGLRFTNLKSESPATSALTVNANGDVVLTHTSGLVNGFRFSDNRNNPTSPSDYNGALKANFKVSSNVGLPTGSSTYSYIIGLRGWGDNSGGKAYELAFNDNNGLLMRSGFDEGWGQWRKLVVETENGRVGIGTSSPTEALEVNGNVKSHRASFTGQTPGANPAYGSLELREIGAVTTTQTSDAYAPRLILHWSGINSKSIALGRNGNIKFNDHNSTTTYAIIETGEIRGFGKGSFIGQTPGASFSHGSLELREIGGVTTNQSTDDYAPRLTFHWGGRLSSSIAMGTSGNLKFNAQGSTTNFTGIEVGNIFSNGNVAINTATVPSGYKLAVKGNVIAEKIVVKTSTAWPDFVFKKDYKLPSLNEVEQFISKNSHLPEIPSAKEVEEKGQDVGEMNRLLLKKVEEITLYLIELKKENQEMKKENHSLKTRVENLEKDKK